MKFSITIPTYKSIYLKETIDSCLAQTCSDFELVIVDDHSPNNIKGIVDLYSDERIRYYRNESNFGAIDVVKNWNTCLNYAKGDYIICMGDDDVLAPNALEEYVRLINTYPEVNLLHSRVITINEKSEPIGITVERPEFETQLSFIHSRLEGRVQFIGDFCFKTNTLRSLGGFYYFPLAWASDDISSFICAGNGVASTNKATFFYRFNPYTISKTGNIDIKLGAITKELEWYQNFLNAYKPSNEIDKLMFKKIQQSISKSFEKKKARTIGENIYANWMNIFKWIIKAPKFHLSKKTILLAIFEASKMRFK